MHLSSAVIFTVGLLCSTQVEAQHGDFLRKVSVREVETDLQTVLSELLSGTSRSSDRQPVIEASTWQTFHALPKNAAGRLAPPAVRYIVHGYFAREHGWLIKGLEPHGMHLNITEVHAVNILQDKAPMLVESLLESRQADRGLSFNDIVAMVMVLEQMMFDESVTLLQAAYYLNGLSVQELIDEAALHKVLQSYLLLFGQGAKANLIDVEYHQALVEVRTSAEIVEFEHDTVLNFQYARRHQTNPFMAHRYSFQAAADIMADLAQRYGKWQNSECRDMKAHLHEIDAEGVGRVPLGLFYAQPKSPKYHFSESADYLRKIGALDETSPGNPQVIVANYVTGPSNCIASSSYYSVCCLSECAELFADLEHHIASPTASPEKLMVLVNNMSDVSLSSSLTEKLHAIASLHDGEVPLHGRLFAQWLHFAFPHECPFPSIVKSEAALTASQWLDGNSVATVEEREQHVSSPLAPTEDFDINAKWSDHEVLPVHNQPRSHGTGTLRIVVQLIAICVALRSAITAWRTSKSTSEDSIKKKDDDCALGFRV